MSVALPVPDAARSITLTMAVEDLNQEVGVTHIAAPDGSTLFDATVDYYTNPVRHEPGARSVGARHAVNPTPRWSPARTK